MTAVLLGQQASNGGSTWQLTLSAVSTSLLKMQHHSLLQEVEPTC
jgi:hypothetical protein